MSAHRLSVLAIGTLLLLTSPALAQDPPAGEPSEEEKLFDSIEWVTGPGTGQLGNAEVPIPEGWMFTGAEGTRAFLELNQNPTNGKERGMLLCPRETSAWFVTFEYEETGHIKDDDRELDADALLASIRQGTEAANEVRRERGWGEMKILGWEKAPFYDPATNNLTWAIRGDGGGSPVVNWSTRLLGRTGAMSVDLVLSPEELPAALPEFEKLLGGFSYLPGSRYAEFRKGDKVAQYGLAALVVGGGAAAAAKSGLLAKFWKVLVGLGVAALAGLKRLGRMLFRHGESTVEPPASTA